MALWWCIPFSGSPFCGSRQRADLPRFLHLVSIGFFSRVVGPKLLGTSLSELLNVKSLEIEVENAWFLCRRPGRQSMWKSLVILIQDMFLSRRKLLSFLNLFGFWDFNQLSGPHRLLVTEFVQDGELFQQVERFAILEGPTWNHRAHFVLFSACCFFYDWTSTDSTDEERWELMPQDYHCGLAGFSSQRG